MKYLLIFAYLILPYFLPAQNGSSKVRYDIEVINQDSFFLSEKRISGTKARPDTLTVYTLFRDTADFILYLKEREHEAETAGLQAEYFKAEYDSLFDRVKRLRQLAKNILSIKDSNKRDVLPGIELDAITLSPEPPGFWVIYPYKGQARAEYITELSQIKKQALILNQNGTTFEFQPPKKKPKTTKNK